MSEFSDYFKDCIHKNHINVSQLARQSGIHRTLLQKIMTGARLPSDEIFLEKVIPFMMLSLRQQEELYSLYQIEKMGRNQYHQHMIIKSFLEHLQSDRKVESPMLNLRVESQPKKDTYGIVDKFGLIQCISSALGRAKEKQNAEVYLLMQDADSSIYDFIASSLYGRKDITLHHILCFQSAETDSLKQLQFNIRLYESITPLLLCGCNYQPMCYYHSNAQDQSDYAPYPYFFLSEDCIINFRKHLNGAIITHEQPILHQFYEFFMKRKAVSIPIILQYQTPIQVIRPYLLEMKRTPIHDCIYTFTQEPFALPLFPIEKALAKLKPEYQKDGIHLPLFHTYLTKLHQMQKIIVYFTKGGLYQFMETGSIGEVPNSMYDTLTMQERLEILNEMIKRQENGSYCAYIVNEKFALHRNLAITVYSENRIIFRYGVNEEGTSFLLNELSFGNMMVSFFDTLRHSNLVNKEEDTIAFLYHVLQEYQDRQ